MTNKRLLKELQKLILQQNSRSLIDNDYIISFDETNINKVSTIIKGPYESVYRHKFIKLDFDIPNNYPHSPPKVTFVFYDNNNFKRIHPNFYEDGRCCSTILNTWNSGDNDKWTSSMGIETVLLTFQSFLDNSPYKYEPGNKDDESYTQYVLYQTWDTCLLKYLYNKQLQPEIFTNYIYCYILQNIEYIYTDLYQSIYNYPTDVYFSRCFEIFNYTINFNLILQSVGEWYTYIHYKQRKNFEEEEEFEEEFEELEENRFVVTRSNTDHYNCNICFDTKSDEEIINSSEESEHVINLACSKYHSFHIKCLAKHTKNNGLICALCREEICSKDVEIMNKYLYKEIWIINPETKRRVKVGGRTYKRLIDEKII